MNGQPTEVKVSVIIPTKNAGSILKKVLKSVMNQKTDWDYEVIVVDSGSTDDTISNIKQYPDIRLIEISPSDFGHGKTRNFAISNSNAEYVAMITHDAIPVHERWLSELVASIEKDENIAGVFGRHIAHEDASPFTRMELEEHFKGFLTQPIVELDDADRYQQDEGYRQFLYFFSDNNALLRKSVWDKIPYPEVDFAEDQAWARLIIESGYKKAYSHDAVVSHSHNFGFFERLQRSFDESYALRRIFNYKNGQGFVQAVRGFVGITLRDFRHVKKEGLLRTDFWQVVSMPIDNFMRVIGHYLGAKGKVLPDFIRMRLSRDRNLMSI